MSESEKIIWTAVASLVILLLGGLVTAIVTIIYRHRADRVSLKADLTFVADLKMLSILGCPGLVLQLSCLGKRPAKVKEALLCLVGSDFMTALQRGFSTDFGFTPPKNSDQKQTFVVGLLPLSPRNASEGYVLARGDVCKFVLPMFGGPLGIFSKAPSEDVTIRVRYFDDTEEIVLQGLSVQRQIDGLVSLYQKGKYHLNPNVSIPLSIRVVSATPPDTSAIGRVNPKAVNFQDPSSSSL